MWSLRLLPHLWPAPAMWGGVRRLGCAVPARGVHTGSWRRRRSGGRTSTRVQRTILVQHGMPVSEMASRLSMTLVDVKAKLKEMRINVSKARGLSALDCERLVLDCGHKPQFTRVLAPPTRDPTSLEPRPPVVAVMGHVDHGKTTLLDSLRQTAVAASEAGGITQHIGAFSVELRSGARLTFLDTPGHAAFSNMRARGAQATDLVVLVVAADDGVMEQTRESIAMVKEAGVPMVVAINKCDKHKKDIARTKRELLAAGVELEEFGGDTQAVEVSALQGVGLEALEEALLVQAEVCQVRGDPKGSVQGVVIETRVDKGLGLTATVVLQHGTLRPGQVLVAGGSWCKVRTMYNERRERIQSAPPSSPVLTTGWKDLPPAGELCLQAKSEQEAKTSCEEYSLVASSRSGPTPSDHAPTSHAEDEDDVISMPLIVKGDVMGSVEALVHCLTARQPQGVRLKVIHSGVGPISDGDMDMALSTKATVLAFGVACPKSLVSRAKCQDITILSHNVIYKLLDMLRGLLEQLLPSVTEEEVLGTARVIQVYRMRGSKRATIGGSLVESGQVLRNATFRVLRGEKVVHEGKLSGLRTEKQDVRSAGKGTQVGIKFLEDFEDFQEDDQVVCFRTVQATQTLKWDLGF